MATRFIGKNLHKKVVRPIKNSVKFRNYAVTNNHSEETKEVVEVIDTPIEETSKKKENKKQKKSKEMIEESKLTQLETIVDGKLPKQNVKIEKSEKGLFERTENSTVLLTEDNKMLLND